MKVVTQLAARLRRTRLVSISILPLPIAPIFRRRIEVWTPRRELNRFYTTSRERRPKDRAWVAIVQRVTSLIQISPGLAGRVARHLLHPWLVGIPGDSGHADTPTLQVNEEQDVVCHQATPGEHFDREEIDAGQYRHMRLNKFLPGRGLAPLRRRRNPVALQNIPYGLI